MHHAASRSEPSFPSASHQPTKDAKSEESEEENGDPSEDEEGLTGDDLDALDEEEDLFYPELTAGDYLYEGFMHDLAQVGEYFSCITIL